MDPSADGQKNSGEPEPLPEITGPTQYVYDDKSRRIVPLPGGVQKAQSAPKPGGILPSIADMYLRQVQAHTPPPEYDPLNVPDGVKGWNWGAFLMTPVWGVSHKIKGAYLSFIPIFVIQLLAAVWMGMKGNEYAWQTQHWQNVGAFRATQAKWAVAGFVFSLAASMGLIAVVYTAINH